eukprot:1291732-Rhodomonas_salina.2
MACTLCFVTVLSTGFRPMIWSMPSRIQMNTPRAFTCARIRSVSESHLQNHTIGWNDTCSSQFGTALTNSSSSHATTPRRPNTDEVNSIACSSTSASVVTVESDPMCCTSNACFTPSLTNDVAEAPSPSSEGLPPHSTEESARRSARNRRREMAMSADLPHPESVHRSKTRQQEHAANTSEAADLRWLGETPALGRKRPRLLKAGRCRKWGGARAGLSAYPRRCGR